MRTSQVQKAQETRCVLSVDPGGMSGWGLLTISVSPKRIASGTINLSKPRKKDSKSATILISSILIVHSPSIEIMVIEDQYVAKNIKSALVLSKKAGRWEEAAATHGIPHEYISATSWQSKELPRGKRKALKLSAQQKVASLFKHNATEDEADAILIGRHFAIKRFYERPTS